MIKANLCEKQASSNLKFLNKNLELRLDKTKTKDFLT